MPFLLISACYLGEATVCIHACCVGMCRTLCSWLNGALLSIWSWTSSHDFWQFYMKYMLLSLFSRVVSIPYCTVSSLDRSGKDLGMRVCVLFSLIWTALRGRLVSFAGASCVISQNRFFLQPVRRGYGACCNSQRLLMLKPSWFKICRAENWQLQWYGAWTTLTGSMRSEKLSSQHP